MENSLVEKDAENQLLQQISDQSPDFSYNLPQPHSCKVKLNSFTTSFPSAGLLSLAVILILSGPYNVYCFCIVHVILVYGLNDIKYLIQVSAAMSKSALYLADSPPSHFPPRYWPVMSAQSYW